MKKRLLLLPIVAGIAYITLQSSATGAGHTSGYDCTGAETASGNGAGCGRAASCHNTSATATINVSIAVYNGTTLVTQYVPGQTYTVKLTGTNSTTGSFAKFGFQMACIKGTTAAATPVNGGAWATTGLPTGTRLITGASSGGSFVCDVVEHSIASTAFAIGTGGTGSTIAESFSWTAPAAGTGTVSFWGAVNLVDGNGLANSADMWNTGSANLTENTHVGVAEVTNSINVNAYPNPTSGNVNIMFNNAVEGKYNVIIYDLSGKVFSTSTVDVTSSSFNTSVGMSQLAPGIYEVMVEKDGVRKVMQVVKM